MINGYKLPRKVDRVLQLAVAIVVVTVLVLTAVTVAWAGGWSSSIQGDCYNWTPKGDRWLNWWGMPESSEGHAYASLYWWNGGEYQLLNTSGGYSKGSSGNALAHVQSSYRAGTWFLVGAAWTNWIPSEWMSDSFSCPP